MLLSEGIWRPNQWRWTTKKGSQYQKGIKEKCHEVKEPNEEIRDNTSLGEYLERAMDTFVEREEFEVGDLVKS